MTQRADRHHLTQLPVQRSLGTDKTGTKQQQLNLKENNIGDDVMRCWRDTAARSSKQSVSVILSAAVSRRGMLAVATVWLVVLTAFSDVTITADAFTVESAPSSSSSSSAARNERRLSDSVKRSSTAGQTILYIRRSGGLV